MTKAFRRGPSASMLVAIIAVIAAASGTAIALPGAGGPSGTNGLFRMQGSATGETATVFKYGPFMITMTCTKDGSGTQLNMSASSSEANSVIDGQLVPTANTPIDLSNTDIPSFDGFIEQPTFWDMETPRGHEGVFDGANGVNSLGADCWANWTGHGK